MQQSIAFSILMILLNKRKVSRQYLAERFSVSPRTVSRYLTVLSDAGVPVSFVPGRGGGVTLPDDYMIDKTFLSEAETLRLKDVLLATGDDYDDNVNIALVEKLETVRRTREEDGFSIKQDDLYIDSGSFGQTSLRPTIKLLSEAIDERRATEIKYSDTHGYISYRTIEPYTLVFREGVWYIYAMCRLRGEFRLFRLSRIKDIRKTSKRFARTESRLVEKLELEYYNEMYVDLVLELFPAVRDSVAEWLGESAISDSGVKLTASAEVPLTDSLIRRLLSYGSSVKVISPKVLADNIREEAKRLLDKYDE